MSFFRSKSEKLETLVDKAASEIEGFIHLPLCHTTTEGSFYNILECGQLSATEIDPIYKEPLIYFFYGMASYIVGKTPNNYEGDPPITFLFAIDNFKTSQLKRILPFDSGGFDKYKVKKGYTRENFSCNSPHAASLQGIIKLLYGNNESYLKTKIAKDSILDKSQFCWVLREFVRIHDNAKTNQNYGYQAFSVELQFVPNIDFNPTYIVLPYDFLGNMRWDYKSFCEQFPGVTVELYGQKEIEEKEGNLIASEYNMLMRSKVEEIIKSIIGTHTN